MQNQAAARARSALHLYLFYDWGLHRLYLLRSSKRTDRACQDMGLHRCELRLPRVSSAAHLETDLPGAISCRCHTLTHCWSGRPDGVIKRQTALSSFGYDHHVSSLWWRVGGCLARANRARIEAIETVLSEVCFTVSTSFPSRPIGRVKA